MIDYSFFRFRCRTAHNIPLLRLKWLEIQGEVHEIVDYKLEPLPSTTSDKKHFGPDVRRLKLIQSPKRGWASHVMCKTRLLFELKSDDDDVEATIINVEGNVAKLLVDHIELDNIAKMYIIRGNEQLRDVTDLLGAVERLITVTKIRKGGIQFAAHILSLGLPTLPIATIQQHRLREGEIAAAKFPDVKYGKETRRKVASRMRNYKRGVKDTAAAIKKTIACGKRFNELNPEQRQIALSVDAVTICQGYPGGGKTSTLACYVAHKFLNLLQRPSGWMLCLTNTNSSCVAIVKHLHQFEELRDFLVHVYSKTYYAFHETLFKTSYAYRTTPKKQLFPHGILVCTIGSLSRITKRFSYIVDRIFDIVTDESSQIWEYASLLFLARLPSAMRWGIFGDYNQYPPYVTKLLKKDVTFPSVMTPPEKRNELRGALERMTSPTCTFHIKDVSPITVHPSPEFFSMNIVRLRIQYRMLPNICNIHAPVFYKYKIESHRQPKKGWNGVFWERTPTRAKLREVHKCEHDVWECRQALEIVCQIRSMNLLSDSGEPYFCFILTPYIKMVDLIHEVATDLKVDLTKNVEVSTVRRIQGREVDAVILIPGRPNVVDLCKDETLGNVGTSRQRDLLIIICSADVARATNINRISYRFWGEFVRQSKLYSRGDQIAYTLRSQMQGRTAQIYRKHTKNSTLSKETSRPVSNETLIIQGIATRALMNIDCYRAHAVRSRLCFTLLLKPRFRLNGRVHKNLFFHMMRCDKIQFIKALDIIKHADHHKVRNNTLCDLFSIKYDDPVSRTVDEYVQQRYIKNK